VSFTFAFRGSVDRRAELHSLAKKFYEMLKELLLGYKALERGAVIKAAYWASDYQQTYIFTWCAEVTEAHHCDATPVHRFYRLQVAPLLTSPLCVINKSINQSINQLMNQSLNVCVGWCISHDSVSPKSNIIQSELLMLLIYRLDIQRATLLDSFRVFHCPRALN